MRYAERGKRFAVFVGRVLNTPVAVKNQFAVGLLSVIRHREGGYNEIGVNALRKGIADDFLGAQILDGGEIQPALIGSDVGDITDPLGIGYIGEKVTL